MKSTIFILCFLLTNILFAQSKKEVINHRIKSVTEIITDYSEGKEVERVDVQKKFDKNGNVLEEINFDKKGNLRTKKVSKYNRDEDKVEETVFDATGKQVSREEYKYDVNGEKVEEWRFDDANLLESKTIYIINHKGIKTERKTFDSSGKLIQTKRFEYGN
jgi:hypothetical protein